MLRRIALRDFVIVSELDVEFERGFSVLTGETGAGKSILIDALQLALGSRGDAGVVREGAQRAEITAVFDAPPALHGWLEEAGFDTGDELLLRRTIDAQGKSRAWINGSAATIAQLKAAGEHLLDIHGQHAWQSLTRHDAVRALLDAYAGTDPKPLTAAWQAWRDAQQLLDDARSRQADLERERERLTWQISEVDKLAPGSDEWDELNAEHKRLSHAQALLDAVQGALEAVSEADGSADELTGRAAESLQAVAEYDASLAAVIDVLTGVQAQLQDASHSLHGYLRHAELDPGRLQELDERLSAWISLSRRYRRAPQELPALLESWKDELRRLDAATDLEALERAAAAARKRYDEAAKQVSQARKQAAPKLAATVTQAMQALGMGGGRFDVALARLDAPQSFGLESIEFLVAGHEGSTPRPLAKVASGGELSRIALAIAVTTSRLGEAGTLIFDEVDAGVGGAVADTVGRLMKQLGGDRQVLAVTHLPAMAKLRDSGVTVRSVFLDASTDTLVRRFSETRRRHPLSEARHDRDDAHRALIEAIELERELLSDLRQTSSVVDTSELRPAQLRSWIKNVVQAPAAKLTLVFESFAFKRGVPLDADYMFDVRVLPNPYYIRELRPQTGRDADVIDYLEAQPEVPEMVAQIEAFIRRWLPAFEQDQRSYLTVAIGCTGGQHRSVYCVEQLAKRFTARGTTLTRHRELDARDATA